MRRFVDARQVLENIANLNVGADGGQGRAHVGQAVHAGGEEIALRVQGQGGFHHRIPAMLVRDEAVAALVAPFYGPA